MAPETTTYEPERIAQRIALWTRQAAICRKEGKAALLKICEDAIAQLKAKQDAGRGREP